MAAVIADQTLHAERKTVDQTVFAHDHEANHSESSGRDAEKTAEQDFQRGVRQARAITSIWNKQTLWLMFALYALCGILRRPASSSSVQPTLNPYITSTFGRHGLLAAVSIVPTILGGTANLTLAKIIDLWGRIEGFIFMLVVVVIGCIVKATSQDIQTYIAAHSLYWTGHLGMRYVINVMLSDMTTLKNRMIILTLNATPQIATTFAGPRVGELFYNHVNFRWAFGAFSFILVGFCLPVIVVMLWSQRSATKKGVLQKADSGRTWWQSIIHAFIHMDSK
ncbi:hypothetical protein ABVK25_012301 [Lepraria finkii]|uniref:Uncharacterized protein n=1 Tax=Lepraria finkii TaxID=1340010 RepID=A0ABR4AIF6_9LECA